MSEESPPLSVAVVGAGYFSQFHYEAWSRIPEVRLSALAEPDAPAARAMAARFSVPAVYETLDALLAETAPDILDIVTPPDTHEALVAGACRRAGLVVCQKPLAPTLEEARTIVEIAREAGCPLVVHENFRFQPWFREAKAVLEAGRLGRPHAVAFRLRPGDGQGPDAYLDRQPYFQTMTRFLVHETAIHLIDTFRYLLGEITEVTARLRRLNPAIAGEDAGVVLLDFESGARGLFDGNRLVDHSAENRRLTMGEMLLEGAEAVLRLDGDGRLFLRRHGSNEEREHAYSWDDQGFAGDCVLRLQRHVVDHLKGRGPVMNTGRAYLANLRVEHMVYESDRLGRTVSVHDGQDRDP